MADADPCGVAEPRAGVFWGREGAVSESQRARVASGVSRLGSGVLTVPILAVSGKCDDVAWAASAVTVTWPYSRPPPRVRTATLRPCSPPSSPCGVWANPGSSWLSERTDRCLTILHVSRASGGVDGDKARDREVERVQLRVLATPPACMPLT